MKAQNQKIKINKSFNKNQIGKSKTITNDKNTPLNLNNKKKKDKAKTKELKSKSKPKPKRNLDKHKQNILLGAKIVNKVPIIDKRQDINIGVLYVLYKIYFKYIIDNKPPKGVIPIINKYMFFSIFAFVGYF